VTAAEINAYLEWRAMREGKTVDVSPEAYATEAAIEELLKEIDDAITSLGLEGETWEASLGRSLRDAQNAFILARNIANGGL